MPNSYQMGARLNATKTSSSHLFASFHLTDRNHHPNRNFGFSLFSVVFDSQRFSFSIGMSFFFLPLLLLRNLKIRNLFS